MYGVTGSLLSVSWTKEVWLLIKLLIYFRVAFIQGLFMSSDNMVTYAKFLGYGIK